MPFRLYAVKNIFLTAEKQDACANKMLTESHMRRAKAEGTGRSEQVAKRRRGGADAVIMPCEETKASVP